MNGTISYLTMSLSLKKQLWVRSKTKLWVVLKPKDCSKPERVKTIYVGGKKQLKENIIKIIRNLFKLKKESEGIKDRIISKQ